MGVGVTVGIGNVDIGVIVGQGVHDVVGVRHVIVGHGGHVAVGHVGVSHVVVGGSGGQVVFGHAYVGISGVGHTHMHVML